MRTRPKWAIAACLALGGIACDALFGDTSQCGSDADCVGLGEKLICGEQGTCVPAANTNNNNNNNTSDGGPSGPTDSSAPDVAKSGGELAKILVSPSAATVQTGAKQQFYATGTNAVGLPPDGMPTYSWSVSGGGTIDGGVFTAGNTAGGPFTVTATSGTISGTATIMISTVPPVDTKIGEVNMLANDDSMNANKLLAQEVTLPKAGTLKSLSFYVKTAAGKLKLGLYDANGAAGAPGAKIAETAEFDAAVGFIAQPVIQQKQLAAGKYWLAYTPNDDALVFLLSNDMDGKLVSSDRAYDGTLPDTFPDMPAAENKHWSFYMTVTQ